MSLRYLRVSQMLTVAHSERDRSALRTARSIWAGPTPAEADPAATSTAAASTVITSAARMRRRYRAVVVMESIRRRNEGGDRDSGASEVRRASLHPKLLGAVRVAVSLEPGRHLRLRGDAAQRPRRG